METLNVLQTISKQDEGKIITLTGELIKVFGDGEYVIVSVNNKHVRLDPICGTA
jgi:hypothetical protein